MAQDNAKVDLVQPLVGFTAELFARVRQDKENAILSPISVHKALNLVLLGAKKGSQSELDLVKVLGYENADNCELYHDRYAEIIELFEQVSKAAKEARGQSKNPVDNKKNQSPLIEVWNMVVAKMDAEFSQTYLSDVQKYYSSSAESIQDDKPESKTRLLDKVNGWAKQAGFESQLLTKQELDQPFSALLMSAIQVEAFWFGQFYAVKRDIAFYNYGLHDQPVRTAETLVGDELNNAAFVEFKSHARYTQRYTRVSEAHPEAFRQLEALDFHAVKVPLKGELDYIMVEPSDGSTGMELPNLIGELLKTTQEGQCSRLAQMLHIMDSGQAKAKIQQLSFPSFKFESNLSLNGPLKRLGLERIFDERLAKLSEMMSGHEVYIGEAKHQAVIEVNENGLRAAAITKMFMCRAAACREPDVEPIRIAIKHPFLFVIRHHRLPLFIGQVVHL